MGKHLWHGIKCKFAHRKFNHQMKHPNIFILALPIIALPVLTSCSTNLDILEDHDKGAVQIPDNKGDADTPAVGYYTPQSTVSDVLNDPCFEDFGRLLFPVDRNVSPSMTLAQVCTSNVYMWYLGSEYAQRCWSRNYTSISRLVFQIFLLHTGIAEQSYCSQEQRLHGTAPEKL